MQSKKTNFLHQSGQAVLIVLLSLSVVLIIVMYVMSRSITDISLSNKEGDSMRAFSAAEAGIERALVIGSDIGSTTLGDAKFNATVTSFAQNKTSFVYPMSLKSGEIATIWLARPNDTQSAGSYGLLCWGTPGTPLDAVSPAIELSIYYTSTPNDFTKLNIARFAYDPSPTSKSPANNFMQSAQNCTIDGEAFQFNAWFSYAGVGIANSATPGVLQMMQVKFLYNTAIGYKLGFLSDSPFPSQGSVITSNGQSLNANRTIEVYQLNPVAPAIFANSVYSGSGILK